MKQFKPMLAPNKSVDLSAIEYPLLASYKLDGIRSLFIGNEMLSRSLKHIPNKQINEKFAPLVEYAHKNGFALDGEIYSNELTFQEIMSFVMTHDLSGSGRVIPEHLDFHVFDIVDPNNLDEPFIDRISRDVPSEVNVVEHKRMDSAKHVEDYFKKAIELGYEGLILRSYDGGYKCGRATIKEGTIYKVKPFITFDAVIAGVVQGTADDKNGGRTLVKMVGGFNVMYNGKELTVSVSSLEHSDRRKCWEERNDLIGKTIEYKGMLVGSKNVPRHPVFVRFREGKEAQ